MSIDFESDTPVVTPEAADFLGVSEANLIQRRHRRQAPEFLKIGKSVRYLPSVLRRFRDECRVHPTLAPGGSTIVLQEPNFSNPLNTDQPAVSGSTPAVRARIRSSGE